MQNLYFHFGHSDWVWVDAEKMMKKLLLPPDIRDITLCNHATDLKDPV